MQRAAHGHLHIVHEASACWQASPAMLVVQATDTLVRAILDDQTIAERKSAAAQPLYEYLFHRLWEPVLTACDHLVVTCSSHAHPRMAHTVEDAGSTAYLDECRAAVDQLSAAEVQAAQVRPASSDLLRVHFYWLMQD